MRKFTNEMLIKLKTASKKEKYCESKYRMYMYCFNEDFLLKFTSGACLGGLGTPDNVGVFRKKNDKWFIVENKKEPNEWQTWYLINNEVKELLGL